MNRMNEHTVQPALSRSSTCKEESLALSDLDVSWRASCSNLIYGGAGANVSTRGSLDLVLLQWIGVNMSSEKLNF